MRNGLRWREFITALGKRWRRDDHDEDSVKFGPCCFCGCDIESTGVDPCRVTVETEAANGRCGAATLDASRLV